MAHPELGSKILDGVIEQVGDIAKVETQARLEGRNMTLVLVPEKKAKKNSSSGSSNSSKTTAAPVAEAPETPAPTGTEN